MSYTIRYSNLLKYLFKMFSKIQGYTNKLFHPEKEIKWNDKSFIPYLFACLNCCFSGKSYISAQ